MTREEAIQVIRVEIEPLSYRQAEALDMAISALSAETDNISRAAATDAIKAEAKEWDTYFRVSEDDEEYGHYIGYLHGLNRGKSIIKELPSVSAERVGEWQVNAWELNLKAMPPSKATAWRCSECRYRTEITHTYCPNCGARMENTK